VRRPALGALAFAVLTCGPAAAGAQIVQLDEADGTVHLTNAPADPRYQRLGLAVPPSLPPTFPGLRAALPSRAVSSIGAHIRDAAERYGIPEPLVTAVIRVESGFNPRAVSRKGARGLMQLMPATAVQLGVRDSFDPAENIDGGVRHLRGLIERFDNDLSLALAAYNAGERAVLQYGGVPPYPETQQYVMRILRIVGGEASVEAGADELAQTPTYRFVEADGATVYTNIPRRPR
jgi:soluble lytic murein transglycosylase-like protein